MNAAAGGCAGRQPPNPPAFDCGIEVERKFIQ
ncbi:hypothetical protein VPARA_21030 [Variovorax paradoxus]|uniref:Uncharacterized protein n=1 Tax=Variovorax paradoxus TaxID=34073 RepID=A0A0H2M3I1_VARPD|nr:hypothetical protein VPARA_21030 [Variovorax paradoxus]